MAVPVDATPNVVATASAAVNAAPIPAQSALLLLPILLVLAADLDQPDGVVESADFHPVLRGLF